MVAWWVVRISLFFFAPCAVFDSVQLFTPIIATGTTKTTGMDDAHSMTETYFLCDVYFLTAASCP